jgi:hypothetical protein
MVAAAALAGPSSSFENNRADDDDICNKRMLCAVNTHGAGPKTGFIRGSSTSTKVQFVHTLSSNTTKQRNATRWLRMMITTIMMIKMMIKMRKKTR